MKELYSKIVVLKLYRILLCMHVFLRTHARPVRCRTWHSAARLFPRVRWTMPGPGPAGVEHAHSPSAPFRGGKASIDLFIVGTKT
jgi:hypothetical protein